MSYDARANWSEIQVTIGKLWPRWNPTDEEATVWYERLSNLNREWVVEALRRVYVDRPSDIPRLKYVIIEFNKLRDEKAYERQESDQVSVMERERMEREGVRRDREKCLKRLREFPAEEVAQARNEIREKYRDMTWVTGGTLNEQDMSKWSLGAMVGVLDALGESAMFEEAA